MKSKIITTALVLAGFGLCAQNNEKQVKVRVKKVENINGVERVTDTTYYTNESAAIKAGDADIKIIELNKDGENESSSIITSNDKNGHEAEQSSRHDRKKVVILKSSAGDGTNSSVVTSDEMTPEMEAEIKKALKEAGVDENVKGRKTVIVHNESKTDDGTGENPEAEQSTLQGKKTVKVVIVHAELHEASSEECKKAGISQPKNKLEVEEMNCTPNPSSGKFNLKFTSPEKGAADIKVRDMGGKNVYSENVKDFGGTYSKEINLDTPAKGIYLVTITQGSKAITKKIVVE